jgi:broad specificity phosphatase PhoE
MNEISISDILSELSSGSRVILQVRHAERPKLDPNDETFGDSLPLTAEGERTARELGRLLSPYKGKVAFHSSPLLRTRMTARLCAEGMGRDIKDIPVHERLGNGSFYYNDPAEVLEIFKPKNFFDACFEYMRTGVQKGFNGLTAASDQLEEWLTNLSDADLTIATTHDLYVAAFLAARGAYTEFSRETWPRFLDAAAIIIESDGKRRYAFVRTGLSNGIVGVAT